jgi:hypothetical protein
LNNSNLNIQNKETLFEKIYEIGNIQKAWFSINKDNIYSHGLSGITIEEYSNFAIQWSQHKIDKRTN